MNIENLNFQRPLTSAEKSAISDYICKLDEAGAPIIMSVDHLSQLCGVKVAYLMAASNRPSKFYRIFESRKKTGKIRKISAPLPVLMQVQRWILDNILYSQPVHASAKGYVPGESIKTNARYHRRQENLLCLDVEDFFPSIDITSVHSIFWNLGYTAQISALLSNLCCLNGSIPQGAPTSGAISNLVLRSFDEEILEFCVERNLRYTRYADDISISGAKFDQYEVISYCSRHLHSLGLRINKKKTRLMRPNNRQMTAGLVVNEKINVPRQFAKDARRDAYYILKYGAYGHAIKRKQDPVRLLDQAIGRLEYIRHIKADASSFNNTIEKLKTVRKSTFKN